MRSFFLFGSLLPLVFASAVASASTNTPSSALSIVGCNGQPLLVRAMESGQKLDIRVDISKAEGNVAPLLELVSLDSGGSNLLNGPALDEDSLQISDVTAGEWRLCPGDGVTVTSVDVIAQPGGSSLLVGGVAGLGVGGALLGISLSGDGDSGALESSPSRPSAGSGSDGPPPVSGGSQAQAVNESFISDDVTPLSPFL